MSLRFTAVVFILLSLLSCRKMQDPVLKSIGNIKMIKPGLATSTVGFDVEYFNPNNKAGKLKEAQGEAWLDSNYVGQFRVDTLIDIPAKANFIIPVKLDVDMKYFLRFSAAGFKIGEILVQVKGNAKVGKGGIYKKLPINYEGKQNLAELVK